MRAGGEHATAERERLALYLLGALDDAERVAFEEHLAGCWQCLDEAATVGPSISGLAGLGEADWSPPPPPQNRPYRPCRKRPHPSSQCRPYPSPKATRAPGRWAVLGRRMLPSRPTAASPTPAG